MSVLVFDLDDTLYDESSYVRSGFQAVGNWLHQEYGIDPEQSLVYMMQVLSEKGRGQVFDNVLRQIGHYSKKNVQQCLSVYRGHKPNLTLHEDAVRCLEAFKEYPMYIVTDGNKLVQQRKLESLGLMSHPAIKKCFISRRFGLHNEKPSPYCFHQISRLEGIGPSDIAYVGDNPNKDFVGIKPLGFHTVRIRRGPFAICRSRRNTKRNVSSIVWMSCGSYVIRFLHKE
ncbi:HAD family hydrolase [Paenibacillus hexagrammi]|uniref:HAD family hydrolase n=1 Tax=Paenibacillus hexagrammi TaxID=2908839 RepID=A0ABY3SGN6_9BACL|nr:HAD family hydrolase [Paenibacillus sp. YPD9-1]UJF33198.1 HAD family hydrolase [Paenibacillus sp. YPD9-1]